MEEEVNKVKENIKLIKKIGLLHEKLEMELIEKWTVSSLERCCATLRRTIIYDELDLPSKESFRFYFSRLRDIDNIEYVLSLLHECWLLVYPQYLFDAKLTNKVHKNSVQEDNAQEDNAQKEEVVLEELLDKSLSKYSSYAGSVGCSSIEDYDSPVNLIVATAYYNKLNNNKYAVIYKQYFKELFTTVSSSIGFLITESFVPQENLPFSFDRGKLDLLFDALTLGGYMKNDKETKYTFISLFENTINSSSKKIQWLDVNEKNGVPSIVSLYTLFSAIGVDMNVKNKKIICKYFNDANNNPISPESLKSRKQSKNLSKIEEIVKKVCTNKA